MATFNGRESRVTVNAATTEKIIAELSDWSIDMKAAEIDTTAFGDGWGKTDVGMKSYSGSFNGFYDPSDTTGQGVINTAYEEGTLINDIRFYLAFSETLGDTIRYLAPATGLTNGIRITSRSCKIDKNGVGSLSVSFTGSGAIEEKSEVLAV